MIKEANIRRRRPSKSGIDETTETDPYPAESKEPIYEHRDHSSTVIESETEQNVTDNDRSYNLEDLNRSVRHQENGKDEQFSNDAPMDLSVKKEEETQSDSEPIYVSKRLQNSRMSPINEEGSSSNPGLHNEESNERGVQQRKPNGDHVYSEETDGNQDCVDTSSRRAELTEESVQRDIRWKDESVNGDTARTEWQVTAGSNSGYENTQWNRSRPINGGTEDNEYGQRWSVDSGVKEGSYTPVSAATNRENESAGGPSQRVHPHMANGDGPLRLHDGSVLWHQPSDVNASGIAQHSDRFMDQIEVESVDSFESERLRGSMVEPMELNRNQVIYSNLKNGNMFSLEQRQNSGYMTPPQRTSYANRDEVPYSSIPHQIERIYGQQGIPNDFRPKPLSVRQSPYGTVRQSPFQDNRHVPSTFRPDSHPNTPVQFLLRQSPYGTIRQSPHADNGNVIESERPSSRQEAMDRSRLYNTPQGRQSSCVVRQSPYLENGNVDMERPPSKQEMLNIAERNRRENIPPPCYEIAKMYSTKAALFENKHHAGQN